MATQLHTGLSLALLEVGNLAPALLVADRCAKAAGVHILGIESADSAAQCIKLIGSPQDVREAGEVGLALARLMGTSAELIVMPSHGYHGVKRLILGSVAERVLRHASCPILVLRRSD